jgi:Cellulase (glycosyl hydrolase family 5)
MRSLLPASLLAAVAALAFAAPPAAAVETGVVETFDSTLPTAQTASELGAGWVRLWASWEYAQPAPGQWSSDIVNGLNAAADAAKARGLKVLMVVQRSPAWASGGSGGIHPPTDPATFGAAMGGLAERVPGVDAWELWNEEDETIFWAGGADPARYAAMVKAAYPAIKAAQPHDIVVTGATTGNNFDFIEALYSHGIKGSFDAVGVHTDTACLVNGPDVHYRDEQGRIGRYTFTGYREVHAVMQRHGDGDKPIWMTELGWNTQSTEPNSCNSGMWAGQKPLGVTEEQQAEFLTQAYRCLAADPYVQVALWFGLQDIPGSSFAGGYGLYRLNGSPKPSAAAFEALSGGIAPARCGGVIDESGPEIVVRKPTDGAKFVEMFPIDAEAIDSPGGVGIERIEVWADGKFARSYGSGHALMRAFWPSREWKNGTTHKITFVGEDEAGNRSSKTVTVTKVRRLPKARTAATVAVEQLDPATVRVTGSVSTAKARAAAKLRGRAFVVFQKQVRGKWKTARRIGRPARKPISVTQRLKPGSWRVYVRYPGRKGFNKVRSKRVAFEIAPPAPPA